MFFGTFTPTEGNWPEFPQIVARQFGIFPCRKKKGFTQRFNDETQTVHGTNVSEVELKRSEKILDKVLREVIMIGDDHATLTKVLNSCSVTKDKYIQAMRRKISFFIRENLIKR